MSEKKQRKRSRIDESESECSVQANECGELGYYSNLSPGRGSLYLLTREEEPFCGENWWWWWWGWWG